MGWRDRDYAKWTDEERRLFLGSSAPRRAAVPTSAAPSVRPGGSFLRAGAGLAIAASAALLLLGQFPRHHPLLPYFHLTAPSPRKVTPTSSATTLIVLPRNAAVGSFLTIRGEIPAGESGTVSVEGASLRPPWRLLAAVPATDGSYTVRVRLSQKGLLHLRILYPDGHRSVGSIHVR
jgi:hypothetical protein